MTSPEIRSLPALGRFGRRVGRLLLLLLPHDVGVPLLPGLEGHALVALLLLGGLGLARVLLGGLGAGQLALITTGHGYWGTCGERRPRDGFERPQKSGENGQRCLADR